ncbi:MAG TPA: hypothetical protein VKU02_28990 [Gemmataceae bacterium]|nr:hypothetical protein [Gemmataceae bacterium]
MMGSNGLRRRPLTIREILMWASAHREATGKWPKTSSGAVLGAKFESWSAIDNALRMGLRGLPGGSSLAQLLAEHYAVRNPQNVPPLSEKQILRWADEHHKRTGSWPKDHSGLIPGSGREKWSSIDSALRAGSRGLPGRSSLAKLLAAHRGVRNHKQLPPLTEAQILAWADDFHARTGIWPTSHSGPILRAPGETWTGVEMALRNGLRGMVGNSSLALLLAQGRGVRNVWGRPKLSIKQILAWADAFHARMGSWPNVESGPISEAPGETWAAVNHALKRGSRGLPASSSLAEVLASQRGFRHRYNRPKLTRKEILRWADAHRRRTGKWPTQDSGPIPESPGDTWSAIDAALRIGGRGLRPGSSLARLFVRYRWNRSGAQRLLKKKRAGAGQPRERTGKRAAAKSGRVVDAPGEKWNVTDAALRQGRRGHLGRSPLRLRFAKKGNVTDSLKGRKKEKAKGDIHLFLSKDK